MSDYLAKLFPDDIALLNTPKVSNQGMVQTQAGNDIKTQAYDYMTKNLGYNPVLASGILGNISKEADFDPTAVNPKSGAYGLFQHLGGRKRGLINYAKESGRDPGDWKTQIDYAHKEMTEGLDKQSGQFWQVAQKVNDPGKVANLFSNLFERAGEHEKDNTTRAKRAREFYQQYAAGGGQSQQPGAIPPSQAFQDTINKIQENGIFYGSGKGKQVFGDDFKEDCCGGFTTTMVNRGLQAAGVKDGLLPTSNLGTGQPKYLSEKFGSLLVGGKGAFTPEMLQSMGEGTVIAGDKSGGGDHAEMIVKHPQTGELVVVSYGVKGKTIQYKQINEGYVSKLNAGNFKATNPFSVINPNASNMVADVTGQTVPAGLQNQQPPEKRQTISDILGNLAAKMGPSAAEAATPPPEPEANSYLKKLFPEDFKEEMTTQGPVSNKPLPQMTDPTKIKFEAQVNPADAKSPSWGTLIKAGMVDDEMAKINIFAASRFPNLSPEERVKRYAIKDNEVYYRDDKGQYVPEVPSQVSSQVKAWIANDVIAKGFENVLSGFGAVKAGAVGAGLGGFAGSITRQKIAEDFLGDKPKSLMDETTTAGIEGGKAVAGYGAGKLLSSVGNKALGWITGSGPVARIAARDFPQFNQAETNRLLELSNRYNIGLTGPEIVNSPTLRNIWANLAKTKSGPDVKIAQFIRETRNPEVFAAIQRELVGISPEGSIFDAGQKAVVSSKAIKAGLVSKRTEAASPIYKQAETLDPEVDISPVLAKVDKLAADNLEGGKVLPKIETIRTLLTKKGGEPGERVPRTTVADLHKVKEEIDFMLAKGKMGPGEDAISNETAATLMNIKSDLMEVLSPQGSYYDKARQTFAQLSKPINDFRSGDPNIRSKDIQSVMERLSNLAPDKQHEAVDIVFNKTAPPVIAKTRRWFVENGYENEWNGLVRAKLQKGLEDIFQSDAAREGNFGYAFRSKIFSKEFMQNNLKAAMSNEQYTSFSDLMELLSVTNRIVYSNSLTMPMQAADEAIKRGFIYPKIASTARNINLNPVKWAFDTWEDITATKNAQKIADALIDPATAERLTRIKQLSGNKAKAIEVLGFIGTITGARSMEKMKDIEPKNP